MALYITNKNQDVLWNVIHNNKYIQEYFSNYDPNFKIEWFRDIIGTFYNKILDTYTSNNGDVLFINKLKLGDSNIEMFTT